MERGRDESDSYFLLLVRQTRGRVPHRGRGQRGRARRPLFPVCHRAGERSQEAVEACPEARRDRQRLQGLRSDDEREEGQLEAVPAQQEARQALRRTTWGRSNTNARPVVDASSSTRTNTGTPSTTVVRVVGSSC